MILPRRLVLSGGGIRVTAIVGALKVLYARKLLGKVKEACGISAGAWLAFMLACECPIKVLCELILELDFGKILNVTPDAFLEFPDVFGLDDGINFVKFLESMFRVVLKIDPHLTFADMAALRVSRPSILRFRCWAVDIQLPNTIREFSEMTTPTVKIIDAIRASSSIPFFFTPLPDPITGNLLVDGGLISNLAFQHLTPDECNDSLGIGFNYPNTNTPCVNPSKPSNLLEFMDALLKCVRKTKAKDSENLWAHKICRIPIQDYPAWNFQASAEDKLMLLNQGIQSMTEWLASDTNKSRKCLRRHSL
jgi:predicted acylesterase/phospholipase RssA